MTISDLTFQIQRTDDAEWLAALRDEVGAADDLPESLREEIISLINQKCSELNARALAEWAAR